MALILPPEADQRRSEISPLSASETFTQGRERRSGAGYPNEKGRGKENKGRGWGRGGDRLTYWGGGAGDSSNSAQQMQLVG